MMLAPRCRLHRVVAIEHEVGQRPVGVVVLAIGGGWSAYIEDGDCNGGRPVRCRQDRLELSDSVPLVPRRENHRDDELVEVRLVVHGRLERPVGRARVLRQTPEPIDTPGANLLVREVVDFEDRGDESWPDLQQHGE